MADVEANANEAKANEVKANEVKAGESKANVDNELERILALSLKEAEAQKAAIAKEDDELKRALAESKLTSPREEIPESSPQNEATSNEEDMLKKALEASKAEAERAKREREEFERILEESKRLEEKRQREAKSRSQAPQDARVIEVDAGDCWSSLFAQGDCQRSDNNLVYLSLVYQVGIGIQERQKRIILSGEPENVLSAKYKLETIKRNPFNFVRELREQREKRIHIFIDNSNVSIGSQYVPRSDGKGVERDLSIRINTKKVAEVVEMQRNAVSRFVAGSHGNSEGPIKWAQAWKDAGYKVTSLPQFQRRGSGVDEMLCNEARFLLRSRSSDSGKNTLVLVTGHGNQSDGKAKFLDIIQQAISMHKSKWDVEVWCWKNSTSNTYTVLADQYPSRISVHYLDKYRNRITWKSKGNLFCQKCGNTGHLQSECGSHALNEDVKVGSLKESSSKANTRAGQRIPAANISDQRDSRVSRKLKKLSPSRKNEQIQRSPVRALPNMPILGRVISDPPKVEVKEEEDEDDNLCIICFDNPITVKLEPCGHAKFCKCCGKDFVGKPCPLCRKTVAKTAST